MNEKKNTTNDIQPKPKKTRSYGVNDVLNWKFNEKDFPKHWREHLGNIPDRFLMYVDGDGGHGKTEYSMLISKMFANHLGKVHLNNVEQGKHKQITESAQRNQFRSTITPGTWMYSNIRNFEEYKDKLRKKNSGRIQIIDSISYWPLSVKQVQELIMQFKYKSFMFVGYKAHFTQNRAIAHLCDIKVRVDSFYAKPISRFGGNGVLDLLAGANPDIVDRLRYGKLITIEQAEEQINVEEFKDEPVIKPTSEPVAVALNLNGHAG